MILMKKQYRKIIMISMSPVISGRPKKPNYRSKILVLFKAGS